MWVFDLGGQPRGKGIGVFVGMLKLMFPEPAHHGGNGEDGILPDSLWETPLDDEVVATVIQLAFPSVSDTPANVRAAKRKDGRRASVEGAEGSTP